jgi:Secretion system C-terminal sorting domain
MWDYLNKLTCNVSAVETLEKNTLQIAPNPGTEGWQITASNPIQSLELYNGQGQRIRRNVLQGADTHWLAATDLPTGVYALKVYFADGMSVKKVVLSR